jgi:hypothetical protein
MFCCRPQFIWANHLRTRVPMVLMAVPDVEAYVRHGVSHAKQPEADALPGFTPLQPAEAKVGGKALDPKCNPDCFGQPYVCLHASP